MAKSLFGKNPDMDDVDFIEAIEAAFGIRFENKEPARWTSFGDVFDSTCRHVGPVERGPFPCLSASAYRRIKSAILKDSSDVDFRPDTSLATLIGRRRVRLWLRGLERSSGLKLPGPVLTNWSGLLLVVALFAVPGVLVVSDLPGWIALLSPVLLFFPARWLPERLPVRTVGEFAHLAAALNAKGLSESHGAIRTRDVWSSLVWIARDSTGFTDPIDRDTVLVG